MTIMHSFSVTFCMLKDISHVLLLFCTFWMVHNMATRWRCLHVHKTSIIHPFSLTEPNKRSFTCSDSIIHINVVDVAKTLNIQHFLNSILHINFQALSLSVDNHNSHMKMSQKWPMYLAEMPLHKLFHLENTFLLLRSSGRNNFLPHFGLFHHIVVDLIPKLEEGFCVFLPTRRMKPSINLCV